MNERLKEINIENFIWVIYLGIIALSWYSNYLEKDYIVNKNMVSKKEYRLIMLFIFGILILTNLYFLIESYKSVKKIDNTYSNKDILLTYFSYIASLLVFIGIIIFFIIIYLDTDIEEEIAFS